MDKKWDRLEGVIGLSINIPKKYKVDFETSKHIEDIKKYLVEVK